MMLKDRKFRVARIWSNREIEKFAPLFTGKVVNVSGWKDVDKEGRHYKDYFKNAKSYHISNYKAEARGMQGQENEFFLDLTKPLDSELKGKFDVVFNHTTLEHIYEVQTAFKNLCELSNDIVMVVVPFLQQMHADYGDFWRFTPLTMKRMFEDNGLELLYLSFNNHPRSSVYLFAIGSKHPKRWKDKIHKEFSYKCKGDVLDTHKKWVGCRAIPNTWAFRLLSAMKGLLHRLRK